VDLPLFRIPQEKLKTSWRIQAFHLPVLIKHKGKHFCDIV
jgi:hypothetical protein